MDARIRSRRLPVVHSRFPSRTTFKKFAHLLVRQAQGEPADSQCESYAGLIIIPHRLNSGKVRLLFFGETLSGFPRSRRSLLQVASSFAAHLRCSPRIPSAGHQIQEKLLLPSFSGRLPSRCTRRGLCRASAPTSTDTAQLW